MDKPHCPICDARDTTPFVERRGVPVHQNLIMHDAAAANSIARGDLLLYVCETCGFIFNSAFDPSLLSYGRDYDNTQTHSPAFAEHAEAMAKRIARNSATILDIGCGQGDFLRRLVELGKQCAGVGYDPSYTGATVDTFRGLRFERRFFDASCDERADLIVCRHVIEHVVDPLALLRAVRQSLSPGGRVFFELRSAAWVLEHQATWDFYYEQCSYFTPRALRLAFERAGMDVVAIQPVFGDQYLLIEAAYPDDDVAAAASRFGEIERQRIEQWRHELDQLGRVALWGAAAKGATFANMVDPDGTRIDCVVDINPNKQGGFLPGAGHAIVSPEALRDRDVAAVVITNPNYHDEIVSRLREVGVLLPVVDLMGMRSGRIV
jgi:SAM-dependent methyltransferase